MFSLNDFRFGAEARNRVAEAADPGESGAVAALESFYFALNSSDLAVMEAVWSTADLAQLNNPVGGIIRGGSNAVDLYRRIFEAGIRLRVSFGDAASYRFPSVAVFAGRETGSYQVGGADPVAIEIRTTRVFAHATDIGRWVQVHHHGSIDDAVALRAYQEAVRGSTSS